jgi:hypothetical protein
VPELSAVEVEMAVEKLKIYKSPGNDQFPAELIKGCGEQFTLRSINVLILFGISGITQGVEGVDNCTYL